MLKLIFKELSRSKASIITISASLIIYTLIIISFPIIEDKIHSLVIQKMFESVDNFSSNVLDALSKRVSKENPEYPDTKEYKNLANILETLNFPNVENNFIVKKIGNSFYVWLDASKKERLEPFTPIQFLEEEDTVISKVIQTKQSQILTHQHMDTIGITLYKPFVVEGNLFGILILDFSIKKLQEISFIISFIKTLIFILTGVGLVGLNIIILSTVIAVYHRKKSIIDTLTGLYNRTFLEDIKYYLDISGYIFTLIDVDFFKKINDTYGHDVGDKVLKEIANLMKNTLRREDFIIRYGGEEFLILIKKSRNQTNKEVINAVERLRQTIENHRIYISKSDYLIVTISTGINLSTDKMKDIDDAIKKADIALYRAKSKGRNRVEIYDELSHTKENMMKISHIKQALEENRVICLYQPIVDIQTGKISHYEALARIVDTDGSLITPYKFITVIENTFLYTQLTKEVLEYNIDILKKYPDIKISINLKPADILNQSTIDSLLEFPEEKIRERLMLEIVETEDVLTYEKVLETTEKLKEKGYKICIDDFGSGYSNFVYLLKLKVDYLKIDANLIKNIHKDFVSREVVKMITQFCNKMSIKVIAEYVENEEITDTLKKIGIKYGQGYYFAKPDYIEKLLK